MDLYNMFLNPNKVKDICFFCLNHDENCSSLHENIEIYGDGFNISRSMGNMTRELIPSYDIILNQVCKICSDLLLKFFITMYKSNKKKKVLNDFIDNIILQINEESMVNINVPTNDLKIDLQLKTINDNIIDSAKSCSSCNMVMETSESLQQHITIAHKNPNNAVICDVCGKTFQKSSSLQAHLKCHTEQQCPYCMKMYKSHSYYRVHLKNHKQQIKTKRKPKYYNCDSCNYTSINKNTLQVHINKIHLNNRPFECDLCDKSFHKKSIMIEHIKTHEKIKKWICDVCGNTFATNKTLIEHKRLHNGDKRFKCNICNCEFVTCSRKNEHIKRKHTEKRYYCDLCGKKFSLNKELNYHMRRVHDIS